MAQSEDISSKGMDRQIRKSFWTSRRIVMLAGGGILMALFVYGLLFMDLRSTLNVDENKLTISTARAGTFHEFIRVTGVVKPIQTIYLDAVEGGVVEEIYRESGTMVDAGDIILKLSNSDLQLNVLRQSSSIYDQINQTRNSRLNIEQNSRSIKEQLANAENQLEITKADYQRQKKLYEQDLIAEQTYLETQKNYEYQQKRYQLIYESFKQDSIKAQQQLRQIDESLERMWRSLDGVQAILDGLEVTAPIAGQLSTIELNPGQSISPGERIGQVDILDNYKVRVSVDEFHLSRITTGLEGAFNFGGATHELAITKVYPVVENGQFQVDMAFKSDVSPGLTRGQTVRIRLELGNSSQALILERGGFYQTTGGNWVYKITEDGERAIRQDIRLGRQNPEHFEVLSGLEPGDRVITSSYDTFGDNEVLNLE